MLTVLNHYRSLSLFSSLLLALSCFAAYPSYAEDKISKSPEVQASPPAFLPPPPQHGGFPWEPPGASPESFNKADTNNDKKVSFDELAAFRHRLREKRKNEEFEQVRKSCDKNNDGIISSTEFTPEKHFFNQVVEGIPPSAQASNDKLPKITCMLPPFALEIMDFDEDGILTIDEVKKAVMSDRPPTKKAQKRLEEKMNSMESKRKSKRFSKCDKNQDQLLSLREALSSNCHIVMFTEGFDDHDTNVDSYLSLDEAIKNIKPRISEEDRIPPDLLKNMPPLARLEISLINCDKDNNQNLDRRETLSPRCSVDSDFFDTIDSNHDGSIQPDEIQSMREKKNFKRSDKNKDGYLDKSEFRYNGY